MEKAAATADGRRSSIDRGPATSQVKLPNRRILAVAKPELGTKRVCPETGRKFYDLNKDPVISPYTGKVVPVEMPTTRARPEPAAAPDAQEADFVSLEDADAEAQDAKGAVETVEPDIEEEVEMDESL